MDEWRIAVRDKKYSITTAELTVMKVLWEQQRCTAAVIIEQIGKHRPWHFRTIKTLLRNLVAKELVVFEVDSRDSRLYHYSPLISEETYLSQEREHFLELHYDGDFGALLNSFLKDKLSSTEEAEAMRELLLQAAQRLRSP